MMLNRIGLLLGTVLTVFFMGSPAQGQSFQASEAVETTANGTINWTEGVVYARGIGAPPAQAVNAAQARAMADRAAVAVAYRNLLETVKGVRVDSQTVVENYMVKSDVIRTSVDGIVRGAQVVKRLYLSDGSVEVLMAMSMKGAFLNAVVPDSFGSAAVVPAPQLQTVPQKPPEVKQRMPAPQPMKPGATGPEKKNTPINPEPAKPAVPEAKKEPGQPDRESNATPPFKGGVATGLVIDGRGLGLRPALLPRIVDQEGREVYVGQVVTRTNAVEQGVAGYARDVSAAENNFRVTDNPAVIKGLNASGQTKTDIVVSQTDAKTIRELSSQGDFLQYCRVIIVY